MLIFSSHVVLGLPCGLLQDIFAPELCTHLVFPHRTTNPAHSNRFDLIALTALEELYNLGPTVALYLTFRA